MDKLESDDGTRPFNLVGENGMPLDQNFQPEQSRDMPDNAYAPEQSEINSQPEVRVFRYMFCTGFEYHTSFFKRLTPKTKKFKTMFQIQAFGVLLEKGHMITQCRLTFRVPRVSKWKHHGKFDLQM